MSNDLLEKQSAGNEYDDDASWYKGSGSEDPKGDDLEAAYNAPDASDDDLPDNHPSKKKKKDYDGDELDAAEKNAGKTGGLNTLPGEMLGNGYRDLAGTGGGFRNKAFKLLARRNVRYGGAAIGVLGTVFIVLGFFGPAFELIHLRENALGNSPFARVQKASLERRRARTFSKMIRQMNASPSALINSEKMAKKFRAQGFDVEFADGKLNKFCRSGRCMDLGSPNFRQATNSFFEGEIGRDISKRMDAVAKYEKATFKGKAARKLYRSAGAALSNWLDGRKTPPDNADGGPKEFADKLNNAGDTELDIQKRAGQTLSDIEKENGYTVDEDGVKRDANGNVVDGDVSTEIGGDMDQQAKRYQELADANPGADVTGQVVDGLEGGVGEQLGDAVGDVTSLDNINVTSLTGKLASKFPRTAAKLTNIARLISITEPARIACRVKGTLNYIGQVKNVLLMAELSLFAIRVLTIADHQKAGLVSTAGVSLLMKYLHSNGGYNSSGAMQWVMGNKSARASPNELASYSLGRSNAGVLARIASIIQAFPGTGYTACKVYNNGFFQIGSAVVGVVAAIFSGGSITAGQVAIGIGLSVLEEAVFQIGTPLILKAVSKRAISGLEPKGGGGALAAGIGALMSRNGNANFGMPAKTTTKAYLQQLADEDRYYETANMSIFERYFSLSNSRSIVSTIAFGAPKTIPAVATSVANIVNNPMASFSDTAGAILNEGSAYAEVNDQCEDPQVIKHQLSSDAFCNTYNVYAPELDLDNTEEVLRNNGMIDADGMPIAGSELDTYSQNCFVGRPGLLYKQEVDKNGAENPVDSQCAEIGAPMAGDMPEEFMRVAAKDVRPAISKLVSPRAQAADLVGEIRTPGKHERFAAWMGYIGDRDNFKEDINDEVEGAEGNTPEAGAINNNLFILGDSLTAGMQSLGGSVASRNYLAEQLNARGWNTTVNAQGCRGVYQPNGPIQGDGSSCPRDTIIDGLTVVNDINQPLYDTLKNSGTYVIGLGTNRTERLVAATDDSLFKQKAIELIDRIRSSEVSPNATIYWVNLSLQNKTNEAERNRIIAELVTEKNIKLIDWATHVTTTNSNASTADDVTFADAVHHDVEGYRKKVAFVAEALGQAPAGSFSSNTSFSCTGYKEIGTGPTNILNRTYSAKIQGVCADMQRQCAAGVDDTRRILCAAFEFDGVYYGNGYSEAYAGAKAIPIYGFNANGGNYGLNPARWLNERQPGLHPKNLLECSGLAAVALYKAYNFSSGRLYCSGQFTERQNPSLFDQMTPDQIKPGDFLTLSFGCNNGGSGHVAIAASTPDANGNLVVYETNSWKRPVRFTEKNLQRDFPGGWSRFKPQAVQ